MSKKLSAIAAFLTLFSVLTNIGLLYVSAETAMHVGGTSALRLAEESLSFEVLVPWQDLLINEVRMGDIEGTEIHMPGWKNTNEQGHPVLPFKTFTIGVPFGADISIQVQQGNTRTISLPSLLLPEPTLKIPWGDPEKMLGREDFPVSEIVMEADPAVYNRGEAYPGALAKQISDGVLRYQRIVGIGVYPVQYNPLQQQLTVYETLTIEIQFNGSYQIDLNPPLKESLTYEDIFQKNLLNYKQALNWRMDSTESFTTNVDDEADSDNRLSVWAPPEPAWRIAIKESGFYQLTYSELHAGGLPVNAVNPDLIQLFNFGEEVAIDFLGDDDALFEDGERFIFYGQNYESKYTTDNIYWLTYGQAAGLRMSTRDVRPGNAQAVQSYIDKKHLEGNRFYLTFSPGKDGLERFLWDAVVSTSSGVPDRWEQPFTLTSVSDGSGYLILSLLGYYSAPSINPDHHVRILFKDGLSEVLLGETWWDGINWQMFEVAIPEGLLKTGENTVIVEIPNDTGAGIDVVYIDEINIRYDRQLQADENQLCFFYDQLGTWRYQIDNFSSLPQFLYDVSDPINVVRLINFEVLGTESASLLFEDQVGDPVDYWAMGLDSLKFVKSIIQDMASDLQSPNNTADYIIITPDEFSAQAQTLVDYRQSQGLRTELVILQDIYDEFNHGVKDANAIHDFLEFTFHHWQAPAPSYVLLLGDGHFDPKNYLGYGRPSYLPPFLAMVDPWIGETASDNRFVTISGEDTLPDMAIGRLSVNSQPEAEISINKIISYEQNSGSDDWLNTVLAVADNADSGGNFPIYSENILNDFVPDSFASNKVYYGNTHLTVNTARNALQAFYNEGAIFVNYIGHAYYGGWAQEDLLTTQDVPMLQNGDKLPVVLAMTCLEGYFQRPNPYTDNREAMGEVVTRVQGRGAVASWSPTGNGLAAGHDFLNRGFLDAYFNDMVNTIGEAVMAGKINLWMTGSNLDLLDTYILFGDPATSLARPVKAVNDLFETDIDIPIQGLNVRDNDIYPTDLPITVELLDNVDYGDLFLELDGVFNYNPNAGWFGRDSFSYRLFDGMKYSNTATVFLDVNPDNFPPIAEDQIVFTGVNTPVDIRLVAANVGVGSVQILSKERLLSRATLTYKIVELPTNGVLSYQEGELPNLTYSPDAEFGGVDTFTFSVNDGELESNIGRVTIFVNQLIYLPVILR